MVSSTAERGRCWELQKQLAVGQTSFTSRFFRIRLHCYVFRLSLRRGHRGSNLRASCKQERKCSG